MITVFNFKGKISCPVFDSWKSDYKFFNYSYLYLKHQNSVFRGQVFKFVIPKLPDEHGWRSDVA